MNYIVGAMGAGSLPSSSNVSVSPMPDPISAATHAIEAILAAAHEAGQHDAVRLLHAVTALLTAAPRH
jgi:hypothetical protein